MSKDKRQSAPDGDAEALAAMEELLQDSEADAAGANVAASAAGQRTNRLEAELDEAKKAVLRSQAELENFRKRMRREMEEERRYASLPMLRDLLAVLDNMQRAIQAAEGAEGTSGLLEGVKMVSDQFLAVLEQNN